MLKNPMLASMIQRSIILKPGLLILLIVLLTGCVVNSGPFEPNIVYYPTARVVDNLPSPFPPLSAEEIQTEWGKELYLGLKFAREFDLYRALTCYKRSLFLAPQERHFEIEYRLLEAYYLGRKYEDAIESFESGCLGQIDMDSPGAKELLLMLYDSYRQIGNCAKAMQMESLIQSKDPEMADDLREYAAVETADFCTLDALQEQDPDLSCFLETYSTLALSPKKAQVLNAILPGAGYYYVGQKKTAVTAFIVNALFTYAAYQFFDRGYIAAGLITTSFEMGWYLGGINGAGLAATELNEATYAAHGKEFLIKKRLFPVLMFNFAF
jgi:tetratricopeptide (TPR) repeat protein